MTRLDAVPFGDPCWIDVMSSDTKATANFYGSLFGWTAEEANPEFGGYFNFTKDGVRIAGAMANQGDGMPDLWSVYIAVEDAQAACDAAVGLGGKVIAPVMDVGTLGAMAVVSDLSDAVIGMWQPGDHKGFGILAEPGAPGWFELHTRNYLSALDFYSTVFGWKLHTVSDSPEFRYSTLGKDEAGRAGIMDASATLPAGMPSFWTVYFAVDDTDAAAAKTVELGGKVVMEAEDSPYGRLATLCDSTGAIFRVMGPNNG